jgi:L-ascorbate metabolism protein UlaG (beta-lactamase superfamily)
MMKRLVLLSVVVLASLSVSASAQSGPASATFTYMGQSTFLLDTSTGLKVLIDPVAPMMSKNDPVGGVDVVTISHEHPDHNYVQLATGSPTILRGLANGDFAKVDQTVKGVRIRSVASVHDAQQGAQRGKNAIFVFELPGLRIAHLGDLGLQLDARQITDIGPVDVLLIPVSGGPTLDPKTAGEVIGQLSAKVVIPMHYGTGAPAGGGARGFSLGTVDDFLKVLDPKTRVVHEGRTLTLTAGKLPAGRTVMVMKIG